MFGVDDHESDCPARSGGVCRCAEWACWCGAAPFDSVAAVGRHAELWHPESLRGEAVRLCPERVGKEIDEMTEAVNGTYYVDMGDGTLAELQPDVYAVDRALFSGPPVPKGREHD